MITIQIIYSLTSFYNLKEQCYDFGVQNKTPLKMPDPSRNDLVEKMMKVRHKSTAFEHMVNQTWKGGAETPTKTINRLVRIRNRRKFDPLEQRDMWIPIWKRKMTQGFKPLRDSMQKISSSKANKRNTVHITEDQQERLINGEKKFHGFISRNRMKGSFSAAQKEELDSSIKPYFLQKIESKKEERRRKNVDKESSKLVKKKGKQFHQTVTDLKSITDEPSLVSLISKFKFENLKTSHDSFESPVPKLKKSENSVQMITPFCSDFETFKSEKRREKMSKTMMKMGWTGEAVSSSISRKVFALTPWEMDKQQMPSTTDIF